MKHKCPKCGADAQCHRRARQAADGYERFQARCTCGVTHEVILLTAGQLAELVGTARAMRRQANLAGRKLTDALKQMGRATVSDRKRAAGMRNLAVAREVKRMKDEQLMRERRARLAAEERRDLRAIEEMAGAGYDFV